MRRKPVDAPALEPDSALIVAERARGASDEGALARAIGSDKSDPPAGANLEIDAVERSEAAEPLGDALGAEEERRAHGFGAFP